MDEFTDTASKKFTENKTFSLLSFFVVDLELGTFQGIVEENFL